MNADFYESMQRVVVVMGTCARCGKVAATVAPEIAEPPYQCSRCRNQTNYPSLSPKFYCTVDENQERAIVWVDGWDEPLVSKTLHDALHPVHVEIDRLWRAES